MNSDISIVEFRHKQTVLAEAPLGTTEDHSKAGKVEKFSNTNRTSTQIQRCHYIPPREDEFLNFWTNGTLFFTQEKLTPTPIMRAVRSSIS